MRGGGPLRRAVLVVLGAVVPSACATLGSGPPVPAYTVPDRSPVRYAFSDSTLLTVATAGTIEVTTAVAGVAALDFEPRPGGVSVRITLDSVRATFDRPEQGVVAVDERGPSEPILVSVGSTGALEVVDAGPMGSRLRAMVPPERLATGFFPPLPAREVQPGLRWVDTVATRSLSAGTVTQTRAIVTSTVLSDTVVAGRRLVHIGTISRTEVRVEGVAGGVDVTQRLEGSTRGHLLWDPEVRLLVERVEAGELIGTLAMPGTRTEPLPASMRVRRRILLLP